LGYIFQGEPIAGNLSLTSNKLDINEFLTGETTSESTEPEATTTEPTSAIILPKNIDFHFTSRVGKVLYDNLVLSNFVGNIALTNGTLTLTNSGFRTLGGRFGVNGEYNTSDGRTPKIAFTFNIDSLDVQQATRYFDILTQYAPISKYAKGLFSTGLSINGLLDHHMNPVLNTLSGAGTIVTNNIVVEGAPVQQKAVQVTRMRKLDKMKLQNTNIGFAIANGRVFVDPFDVIYDDYTFTFEGSNGLDQTLDYKVRVDAPTGDVGQAAVQALNSLVGNQLNAPERVKITFRIGGTNTNPQITDVRTAAGEGGNSNPVQNVVQDVRNQAQEQLNEARNQAQQEAERARAEAEARARAEAERARAEAERQRQAAEQRARQEAERARAEAERQRQEAERRAREEADRIRNNLPRWPR
jgi:hypothetical protein